MYLCKELSIPTVRLLLKDMTATDIARWHAFFLLEHEELKPKKKSTKELLGFFKGQFG